MGIFDKVAKVVTKVVDQVEDAGHDAAKAVGDTVGDVGHDVVKAVGDTVGDVGHDVVKGAGDAVGAAGDALADAAKDPVALAGLLLLPGIGTTIVGSKVLGSAVETVGGTPGKLGRELARIGDDGLAAQDAVALVVAKAAKLIKEEAENIDISDADIGPLDGKDTVVVYGWDLRRDPVHLSYRPVENNIPRKSLVILDLTKVSSLQVTKGSTIIPPWGGPQPQYRISYRPAQAGAKPVMLAQDTADDRIASFSSYYLRSNADSSVGGAEDALFLDTLTIRDDESNPSYIRGATLTLPGPACTVLDIGEVEVQGEGLRMVSSLLLVG